MDIFLKIWYNYLDAFVKFNDFKGRSNKYEFWSFIAVDGLVKITVRLLTLVAMPFFYVYMLYALLCIIPTFAVITRRVHDVGRSGWWIVAMFAGLLAIIPFLPGVVAGLFGIVSIIAVLYVFVLVFCPSDKDNKYGPVPVCTKDEALFANLLILVSLALPITFATYAMQNNQFSAEILRNRIELSDTIASQSSPLATSATVPQNSAQ